MNIFAYRAVVEKELLSIGAGTDRYHVNNKHDFQGTVQSPEEIVSKAERLVGQTIEYKLISKNCEHFANCLRYNVAWSDQVWDTCVGILAASCFVLLLSQKI
ncbi:HRAS-like suppressor 3 [Notechis scutatus]|uniref:HRAS-like suppressor 3 n=1 Tax=Notechis scutatus TaxID=8663 RepID=A0A6J1VRV9_9SAUR|nr:HRAS-like suppressor 3 [Notechis scutatus]